MIAWYRRWKLRRRIRARARVLADDWIAGVTVGSRDDLEQIIYEAICNDHAVKP